MQIRERMADPERPKWVPEKAWKSLANPSTPKVGAIDALEEIAASCTSIDFYLEAAKALAKMPLFARPQAAKPVRTVASHYFRFIGGGGTESVISALCEELGGDYRNIVIADGECKSGDVLGISLESAACENGRYKALAQVLRENEVDVLICHDWYNPKLLWEVVLCRILGVRAVLYVHGLFSHFLDVTDSTFADWNDGRLFCLVPCIGTLCDAVVCQTQVNKHFFSKFNPASYEIPNVVKRDSEPRRKCGESSVRTVLWVGRIDPFKHPEDALKAFAIAAADRPELRMVMVGESWNGEYEARLAEMAKMLGVADRFCLPGWQEDVDSYYSQADVFLLTSEIEGYCMVLAEALLHALPVVAYDMPYLPFKPCGGIAWVGQGDIELMAQRLEAIVDDDGLRRSMGDEGYSFYVSNLMESSKDGWRRLMEDLAGERADAAKEDSVGSQSDALSCEKTMWDTLFYHYIVGAERTHKLQESIDGAITHANAEFEGEKEARERAQAALVECRSSYENSRSYRLGRALLAPARAVRRLVKG